jgi:hypothetical protein
VGAFSLQQLDRTRNALNRMLCAVNNMHNTKVPINTVIKDIVYRIFFVSVSSSEHPARQSLDISHVCRHWRQLALEWPVLWTSIDSRFFRISMLFLERATNAPLDLAVSDRVISPFTGRPRLYYLHQMEWRKLLPRIPPLIPRLRSLTLHIDDPEHAKEILPYFSDTHTIFRLQALDICLPSDVEGQRLVPFMVPERFLDPAYPPKSLVLHHVVVPWDKTPIHGLTRLVLLEPNLPPTLHQLMSIISASRGLEELELKSIFAPVFPMGDPIVEPQTFKFDGEVVDLPNLWKMHLALSTSMCASFLQPLVDHIHAPTLKSFSLDSLFYAPAPTPDVFELLPSNPPYPFETLTHVHVTQSDSPRSYVLQGRLVCDGPPLGQWNETNLDLLLTGPIPLDEPADCTFILVVLRMLRGVQRLELQLDAWRYLDPECGIDLAVAMPRLSTLEILGELGYAGNASEVLERLIRRTDITLRTLSLRFVEYDGTLLAKLTATTLIREIHLDQCSGVDAGDVSTLQDSGVTVYWSEEMSFDEKASIWGNNRGNLCTRGW